MRAIDGDALKDRLQSLAYDDWNQGVTTSWADAYRECADMVEEQPTIEPEVIRCKDCKWWGYDDDDEKVRVCHAAKHGHMSPNWSIMIYRTYKEDFYCAFAERRTE